MTQFGITLSNGVEIPALGLGVLQSVGDEAASAVETALRAGYRLIDTAAAYGNEREVGRGIRQSGVAREDVFLTTKLWMTITASTARCVHSTQAPRSSASTPSTCTSCTGRGQPTATAPSPLPSRRAPPRRRPRPRHRRRELLRG